MEKVVGVMPFNFFMVLQNFGCAEAVVEVVAAEAVAPDRAATLMDREAFLIKIRPN